MLYRTTQHLVQQVVIHFRTLYGIMTYPIETKEKIIISE